MSRLEIFLKTNIYIYVYTLVNESPLFLMLFTYVKHYVLDCDLKSYASENEYSLFKDCEMTSKTEISSIFSEAMA